MDLTALLAAFRVQFPEFDALPDSTVTLYLQTALTIFAACELAILYLTAHLIKLGEVQNIGVVGDGAGGILDGGSGETTSEKVGNITVTLKTMADTGRDTFFSRTAYGRMYMILRDACPTYTYSARVY